jgi:signal transduction histidine kinase
VRLDEVMVAAVREATPLRGDVLIRVTRLDDVTVSGDPLGLEQVLANVLDNALGVSPADSEVTVALSASDDRACVTVTDSGPGMAPGERERIFDPFYSNKPAGCAHAGAGLGLAIARSIARERGGDLLARSKPGAGATFELILPLSTGSRDARPPDDPEDQEPAAGRRTTNRAPSSLG